MVRALFISKRVQPHRTRDWFGPFGARRLLARQHEARGEALAQLERPAEAAPDSPSAAGRRHSAASPHHSGGSGALAWQGKPADKAAACALFPGKLVAGPGWCSAWVKKA